MATADQLKALIKSHYELDSSRFTTVAMQVAAYEANNGHNTLAHELKRIIDHSKKTKIKTLPNSVNLPDIIQWVEPKTRLENLIAPQEIKTRLKRIIKEFYQRGRLEEHGLQNRRKVLLSGPPGTGKTMTSEIIATELGLPLNIILVDKMVTKYMGETAAKLRQVFDVIGRHTSVYLFDEFDALGSDRSRDNEQGEMRRVLNSFLQFLEQDKSNSFIIAATNNINLLDQALFRRFDDILFYQLPTKEEVISLIKNRFAPYKYNFNIESIAPKIFKGLSHAEITQACDDTIKEMVLNDKRNLLKSDLMDMLKNKKDVYTK